MLQTAGSGSGIFPDGANPGRPLCDAYRVAPLLYPLPMSIHKRVGTGLEARRRGYPRHGVTIARLGNRGLLTGADKLASGEQDLASVAQYLAY